MKKLLTLTLVFAATMLASCQKEAESVRTITFSAQIQTGLDGENSRSASKETFTNGDQIGVFVVPYADASTPGILYSDRNYADNVPFQLTSTRFTPTVGNSVSFPTAATKVSLYAFAMYHTQYNKLGNDPAAVAWTIDENQSTLEAIRKNDVMTAQVASVSQSDTEEPVLTFAHRLSIAQIEFTAPKVIRGSAVTSAKVSLPNFKNKLTIDMKNNAAIPLVDQASAVDFNAYQVAKSDADANNDNYIFESIVAPQSIAAGQNIVNVVFTTQDNQTHTFLAKVADTQDGGAILFRTGTRTKLAFQFTTEAGSVSVGNAVITAWENTDPINLQISRPFRLLFNVDEASKALAATVAYATVTIDGSAPIFATAEWKETTSVIECKFVLPFNYFADKLTNLALVDNQNLSIGIASSSPAITDGLTINGDPTAQDYDVKISTLTLSK